MKKEIKINGKAYKFDETLTVLDFLKENGFNLERIAVEKDGLILPRNLWQNTKITSGTNYEIVEFVGGG